MRIYSKRYSAEGIISVNARGYWFSGGGMKGAFGYYPHLKTPEGFPVYPDTQVRGNLKTAVMWYHQLIGKDMSDTLFGKADDDAASPVKVTDLLLTQSSRKIWTENQKNSMNQGGFDRFQVKSRIKIDPDKKSVAQHFLVDLEMAWLEGLTLTAAIYLHDFESREELQHAMETLKNAVPLLPGMGAFRSRGYGRGEVTLDLHENQPIQFSQNHARKNNPILPDLKTTKEHDKNDRSRNRTTAKDQKSSVTPAGDDLKAVENPPLSFDYYLTALVHMRNKPPGTGTLQHIETFNHITAPQIRAWFVWTWHALFGKWPDTRIMERIHFSPLYPTVNDGQVMTSPPPATTLKNEMDEIEDCWQLPDANQNMSQRNRQFERDEQQEKFLRSKTKPLGSDAFVTHEERPRVFEIHREIRIRNKLDEQFITPDNALFVQEFISHGTRFGGKVTILNPSDRLEEVGDFMEKARYILETARPMIKGCLYSPSLIRDPSSTSQKRVSAPTTPLLLKEKMSITPFFVEKIKKNQGDAFRMENMTRYNTVLRRHQRNRIVIQPASILMDSPDLPDVVRRCCTVWNGFGKSLERIITPPSEFSSAESWEKANQNEFEHGRKTEHFKALPIIRNIENHLITASQAGQLREMLNTTMSQSFIEKALTHRIGKYEDKNEQQLLPIMKQLFETLNHQGLDAMRNLIRAFLDAHAASRWHKNQKKQKDQTKSTPTEKGDKP